MGLTHMDYAIVTRPHGIVRMGLITAQRLASEGKLRYDGEYHHNGQNVVYYTEA